MHELVTTPWNLNPQDFHFVLAPNCAYVDPNQGLIAALTIYQKSLRPDDIQIKNRVLKIWFDEREIWGSLQWCLGYSLVFPRLNNPDSPFQFFPLLLGHNVQIAALIRSSKLEDSLAAYYESTNESRKLTFMIVVDWMAFILLDPHCGLPSSDQMCHPLCPCCEFNAQDKYGAWRAAKFRLWVRMERRRTGGLFMFINIRCLSTS